MAFPGEGGLCFVDFFVLSLGKSGESALAVLCRPECMIWEMGIGLLVLWLSPGKAGSSPGSMGEVERSVF